MLSNEKLYSCLSLFLSVCVSQFGSRCCRGTAKTRIAEFAGLRCSFWVIDRVEQRFRDVCLRVWILTLEGMFCFRVCLGEEHACSELHAHRDESRCLGSARVCSYSRGMQNKGFVSRGSVPQLLRHSFSPCGHRFDLRDLHTLSKRVVGCHGLRAAMF